MQGEEANREKEVKDILKWLMANTDKWKRKADGQIELRAKEEDFPPEILEWIEVFNNGD